MATKGTLVSAAVCGCAIILLASCKSIDVYGFSRGPAHRIDHGPPAHAKAYGYREKQACGHDMEYSAIYNVYVVKGVSDCYYQDGHFYRYHCGHWEISLRVDGDWGPVHHASLPPGLQAKANSRGSGKAKTLAKVKF